MKNLLVCLAILFTITSVCAQNWCPPGATWHIKRGGFISDFGQTNGIIKMSVTKDTTVVGIACKRLDAIFRGKNMMGGPIIGYDVTFNYRTHYTYSDNNIIFLYNGTNAFDTLVNFNAVPGDKWLKPRSAQTYCFVSPVFTVTDTSHIVVNGFYLKQIKTIDTAKVQGFDNNVYSFLETHVFVERILFTDFAAQSIFPTDCEFYPGASDGPPLNMFRCYEDNTFPVYVNNMAPLTGRPCDFTTGLEAISNENLNLSIYPNPNNGSFELELQQATNINILNLLGNVVYSASHKVPGKINVDAAHIAAGVYILRAKSADGTGEIKFVVQ